MLPVRPPIDGGTIVVTGASGGIGRELARPARRPGGCVVVARTVERFEGEAAAMSWLPATRASGGGRVR